MSNKLEESVGSLVSVISQSAINGQEPHDGELLSVGEHSVFLRSRIDIPKDSPLYDPSRPVFEEGVIPFAGPLTGIVKITDSSGNILYKNPAVERNYHIGKRYHLDDNGKKITHFNDSQREEIRSEEIFYGKTFSKPLNKVFYRGFDGIDL